RSALARVRPPLQGLQLREGGRHRLLLALAPVERLAVAVGQVLGQLLPRLRLAPAGAAGTHAADLLAPIRHATAGPRARGRGGSRASRAGGRPARGVPWG